MRNYYSDPTANAAIGSVDHEMKKMRKEAERLATLRRNGRLSYEDEIRARARFTGIFRRIWDEAMDA